MKYAKTKMLKQTAALSLLPATLLLTQGGCQGGGAPQLPEAAVETAQDRMTGCTWLLDLSSLSGVAANVEKPGLAATLVFESGGKVHGSTGVNQYFGSFEIADDRGKLKFGTLGCTMMAGPGLEYERAFLDALAAVDSYEITEGNLLLKSQGKVVAKLSPGRK